VRVRDGEAELEPWAIDYKPFNDPARNAFYASPQPLGA
jgi:hypothetical protein